eukprot:6171896-Pleurochrysis_carterae.AAC.3
MRRSYLVSTERSLRASALKRMLERSLGRLRRSKWARGCTRTRTSAHTAGRTHGEHTCIRSSACASVCPRASALRARARLRFERTAPVHRSGARLHFGSIRVRFVCVFERERQTEADRQRERQADRQRVGGERERERVCVSLPYRDAHGEVDLGLTRGKPLSLSNAEYEALARQARRARSPGSRKESGAGGLVVRTRCRVIRCACSPVSALTPRAIDTKGAIATAALPASKRGAGGYARAPSHVSRRAHIVRRGAAPCKTTKLCAV